MLSITSKFVLCLAQSFSVRPPSQEVEDQLDENGALDISKLDPDSALMQHSTPPIIVDTSYLLQACDNPDDACNASTQCVCLAFLIFAEVFSYANKSLFFLFSFS